MLTSEQSLISYVEYNQLQRMSKMHSGRKEKFEQFFTSGSIAKLMASRLDFNEDKVRILDPGAGSGILFTACINKILEDKIKPNTLEIVAFEVDPTLVDYLKFALDACEKACKVAGINFKGQLKIEDFIESSIKQQGLFVSEEETFTHVIVNPPYKKLNTNTGTYDLLKRAGKASPNLYTAFLSMAETYLRAGGQLVSITPRSFCNGVYFRHFREQFLRTMDISLIHIFTSRNKAFRVDKVLQENVIIKWIKSKNPAIKVKIFSGEGPEDEILSERDVDAYEVIFPEDDEHIIRIVQDENQEKIRRIIDRLQFRLKDIGLKASTGPIVDFRSYQNVQRKSLTNTVPLIQPECVSSDGFINWDPYHMKKSPFIEVNDATKRFLIPDDVYVIIKRFTSNEEKKRIVASVYWPLKTYKGLVGFENRVNYIHQNGNGVNIELAKGLALYLNSTLVDSYFRQISGHTQVNASDLERLKYPDTETLRMLGNEFIERLPCQVEMDRIINEKVFHMSENENDPLEIKKRIGEALEILKDIGMPREQQNERSALTLLALLDLKPTEPWHNASNPLIGITPMMKFFEDNYGKKYAPNSRETVRRFTVHQFLQAHLVIENPDDPTRPTNSPKAVYQIDSKAIELMRNFGSLEWDSKLKTYLKETPPLDDDYRGVRNRERIKICVSPGVNVDMSPGGQNVLVEKIVTLFIPKFINNPRILYIGDAENKFLHFDEDGFKLINVDINLHGKIPDVIILDQDMKWLYLIEAVTSHGPINKKRRNELAQIFGRSTAGLVYVTAFPDRGIMVRYLREISWQSEVWLAETPDHMIHFNGDRFLGPYE